MDSAGPYNWARLISEIGDERDAVQWVLEKGLIPRTMNCPLCGREITGSSTSTFVFGFFSCKRLHGGTKRKPRRFKMTTTKNTFFERSKLPVSTALKIVYCFASGYKVRLVMRECDIGNNTVISWFSCLREVCQYALENKYNVKYDGECSDVKCVEEDWRGECKRNGNDPFLQLIEDVKFVYPGGLENKLSRCTPAANVAKYRRRKKNYEFVEGKVRKVDVKEKK